MAVELETRTGSPREAICAASLEHLHSPSEQVGVKKEQRGEELSENLEAPRGPIRQKMGGAPDGGWGWMCVLGCALMHFLLGGYGRSYGLIYVQMLERFHCSAAMGSTIGGVFTAVRMGCGELL